MYSYLKTEESLWTTGHYDAAGYWHPERDCGSPDYAAARVAWLNGAGEDPGNEKDWGAGASSTPAQQRTIDVTALLTDLSNSDDEIIARDQKLAQRDAEIKSLTCRLSAATNSLHRAANQLGAYLNRRKAGTDELALLHMARADLIVTQAFLSDDLDPKTEQLLHECVRMCVTLPAPVAISA